MAVITDLKLQKNKSRANVYLDNVFVCGLEVSTIAQNYLKIGTEISQLELEKIQLESEVERAKEKALSLLERQKYTKKQLRTKLSSKGYLPNVIDEAITKLEEYGYISDTDFAESFLRSTSTKSKKEIMFALKSKGVNDKVISEVLEDSKINEEDTISRLAEKFMKYKEPNVENKKKMIAYLYRKGFDLSLINSVASKFGVDLYE